MGADTSKGRWIPASGNGATAPASSKSESDGKSAPGTLLNAAKEEPELEKVVLVAADGKPASTDGNEKLVLKERTSSTASSSGATSASSAPAAGEGEPLERKRGMLDRLTSIVHPKIAAATIFVIVLLTTQ